MMRSTGSWSAPLAAAVLALGLALPAAAATQPQRTETTARTVIEATHPGLSAVEAVAPERLFRYGRQTSKKDRAVIAEPDGFTGNAARDDRRLVIVIPGAAKVDLKRLNSEVFKVADGVTLEQAGDTQHLIFALKQGVVVQTGRLKGDGVKTANRFVVDMFWPGELQDSEGTSLEASAPAASGAGEASRAALAAAPEATTAQPAAQVVPVVVGNEAVQLKTVPEEAAARSAAQVPAPLRGFKPGQKPQAPVQAAAAPPAAPAAAAKPATPKIQPPAVDLPVASAGGFAAPRPPNVPELPPARMPEPAKPQIVAPDAPEIAVVPPPAAPEAPAAPTQVAALAAAPAGVPKGLRPNPSSNLPPIPVMRLLSGDKPVWRAPTPTPVAAAAAPAPARAIAPPPMTQSTRITPDRDARGPELTSDRGRERSSGRSRSDQRATTKAIGASDSQLVRGLLSADDAEQLLLNLRNKR